MADISKIKTPDGTTYNLKDSSAIHTVDQVYDATSTNAQSGVAVAQAIAKKPGEITTGKQYTIDGSTVVAKVGAEVFNSYTANKASGFYSHAEGLGTTASSDNSHAEGWYTTASGISSHAEGNGTTASGISSHAEGNWTTASGGYSHAEGGYTTASSTYQHVQGKYNVEDVNNTYAFIIGNGTADNTRHNAFAIDWNGLIYVNGAATGVDLTKKPGEITTGKQYTIDGQTVTADSGAEVFNDLSGNKASGLCSHAEGGGTTATGDTSHAEGGGTIASGTQSHAECGGTTASGSWSHAEGAGTIASGSGSHAEGSSTHAFGAQSHAEGSGGYAVGDQSHAEGYATYATGAQSHAEGYGTLAFSSQNHVQGKYNVADNNNKFAFIIGNGTADNDRHNAFAVDWNGLIYVNGASTGVDVSAFPSPADINTAITKSNAAAPQSTTYTKTEVDSALAAKLNTSDVDADLSRTSTNPVQNRVVQAPVARLVDAGAKNIFDPTVVPQTATRNGVTITRTENGIHVSGTVTATGDTAIANNIGLVIPSDGYRLYAKTTAPNLVLWMEYKVNGSSVYSPITSAVLNSGYVLNYIYFKRLPGGVSFDVDVDIMLCTAEDYAISPEFVPYAKSNYELTQVTEPIPRLVDAGAKNFMPLDTATFLSGGVGNEFAVKIPIGDYVLSCNCSATSSTSHLYLFDANHNEILHQPFTNSANKKINLSLASEAVLARFDSDISNTISKIMICTTTDYAISSEFVSYAKSNYELTQDVEPIPRLVDSGAKNLLKIAATTQTINGVTFTVNDDETVTVNGTNTGTGSAAFVLVPYQQANLIPDGNYWLSGCPQGGGSDTFDLRWYRYSPNASAYDRGSGAAVHKSGNTTDSNIAIVVKSGVTVNNITFKPMLCTQEDYAISPEFVPYAMSNADLTDSILNKQDVLLYTNRANATTYSFNGLTNIDSNLFKYGILIGGGSSNNAGKVMIWHVFVNTTGTVFFTKIIGNDTMTLTGSISNGVLTITSSATIYGGIRLIWLG